MTDTDITALYTRCARVLEPGHPVSAAVLEDVLIDVVVLMLNLESDRRRLGRWIEAVGPGASPADEVTALQAALDEVEQQLAQLTRLRDPLRQRRGTLPG